MPKCSLSCGGPSDSRCVEVDSRKFGLGTASRSLSSALLPFCGWEGAATEFDYGKIGTLILPSLLEDLGIHIQSTPRPTSEKELHFGGSTG